VATELTNTWIDEARQGNELALKKLLAACYPVLHHRISSRMDPRMRPRLEPEDMLQQIYLEVFRRIDGFENRGPNSFLTWVLTIADSKLADAHRECFRKKRDLARELRAGDNARSESAYQLLDQAYADSTTPSRVVRRDEAVAAVVSCLDKLSDAHRAVLELRFLRGLSVGEVASRLGKSEASIVAATKRALAALRTAMDERGEFTRGA